jgi:integrase
MNTTLEALELKAEATAPNVVQLSITPKPKKEPAWAEQRFKVKEFENASGKTTSWRVDGYKRDGTRVRENFSQEATAKARAADLELEYLGQHSPARLRETSLTDNQLRLAEAAFIRLPNELDLLPAIEHWINQGKQNAVVESPRLDDATDKFFTWLTETETLRPRTKSKLKNRVKLFRRLVPNSRVADIGPQTIEGFFSKRSAVSALTKVGDREAISRFFSWCMARPREWTKVNPCSKVEIERNGDVKEVQILTVDECRKLLAKAETHRKGRQAPYVAVCLFGGLRPTEAQRLTWDKVNLTDGEIRIEAQSSKRKEPRVITIGKTLAAWLKSYKNKPFHPKNFRRDSEVIKRAAGYTGRGSKDPQNELKPWPADILRHTAISHFFRHAKSYGETAEWAGNSEAIIRKHYQGKVSSQDTKKFYALLPKKGARK